MTRTLPPARIRRRLLGAGLAVTVALASGATRIHAAAAPLAATDDEAAVLHVLSRLTYGPRPGDVETVRAQGLGTFVERQLHPERIPDPKTEEMLKTLETHGLSTERLLAGYALPREAKKEAQRLRAEMGENASEEDERKARRDFMRRYAPLLEGSPRQVVSELGEAKVLRAVYGERQLDEVLVDFWLNHFNVYAQKGPVKFFVAEYERHVLRPHAWGRFEDLLLATAESPAMLFYLDNWLSAGPHASARGKRSRGLNENYAREIMELHTLGVDGGYSQKDVTEVARCFTGWTIRGLRQGEPRFAFDARLHDGGDKLVLGTVIRSSGQDEGRKVIHLLATHRKAARFIATKLVRRLVADDPPALLVDRAANVFRRTDGDIRAVVTAIVTAPEFLGPQYRAAKVKTPLELVVSAVRASGATVVDAGDLARRIGEMGMPLYQQQPPTGYKDTAEAWVSTSGLLARLNFALDLASGRVAGVILEPSRLAPETGGTLTSTLTGRFVPGGLSVSTRETLEREAASGLSPARVAGLLLGSPEFQRR